MFRYDDDFGAFEKKTTSIDLKLMKKMDIKEKAFELMTMALLMTSKWYKYINMKDWAMVERRMENYPRPLMKETPKPHKQESLEVMTLN